MIVKKLMLTAFHSQTDRQIEWMNQTLECYLCYYINYQQDNWVKLILSAEYVYNSSINSATEKTSFKIYYHFQSAIHMWVKEETIKSSEISAAKEAVVETNDEVCEGKDLWEKVQKSMSTFYDWKWKKQEYKVGDLVLLSSQNICMWRACKKLANHFLRPFKIEKMINLNVYKLELLKQYSRIHPTFHVSLLKLYKKQPGVETSELITVENIKEYVVKHMLDAHVKQSKHQYLIWWEDYSLTNDSWELIENLKNTIKMIKDFKEAQAAKHELPVKSMWKADKLKKKK